jgi:transposase-like protein
MQLWESDLVYVPKCLHCHGRPRMHRHGKFKRTGSDGLQTPLQRYRCPRCLRTCSILRDGMLPYRRISAEELQTCLDNPQQFQAKAQSHKLPKPVLSAAKRFHHRARWLFMLLGVGGSGLRWPISIGPGEFSQRLWESLRQLYGEAATILRVLASNFRTSLLHDYRCLIRPTSRL